MKRRIQIQLKQLAVIAGAWLVVGVLIAVYDHLVLLTSNSRGLAEDYSFTFSLTMNLVSAIIGALFGGSLLVFYINVKYQNKSYVYTIMSVGIGYVLVIVLIVALLGAITVPMKTGRPLLDPVSVDAFNSFLMDSSRAKNIMIWSMVVALTQLLLQLSSKFGQRGFGDVIRGKYNTPKEENRIFMFLDLNASTGMAEQLGDEKYHDLLHDFYADIANPILDNKGEIVQYVGDEVVVAWQLEEGVENNQCVRCFFDIKDHIQRNSEKYLRRYGLVPSFKAGIHCGKVVAGEVGTIKRDITYSGDVLNTTSRILSMCKELNAEIISSGNLMDKLQAAGNYVSKPLGAIKLKGKANEVLLNAITPMALT